MDEKPKKIPIVGVLMDEEVTFFEEEPEQEDPRSQSPEGSHKREG